jgi:hypothetical protein
LAAGIINGQHKLALFLGGDHSVGIPLFRAFAKSFAGPVGYVQFDSHADLADEFAGHPWSHANTARRNLEQPNLSTGHMAFVGLRSFLQEELEFYAANSDLGWHTARSIYRRGIEAIAQDVVAQLNSVSGGRRPQRWVGPPAVMLGPPAVTFGPPAVTFGPPAVMLGPPAVTFGPPAVTFRPPAVTL